MNPVPTPWPSWGLPNSSAEKMSVVTFTVAGRTRFTTAATGSLEGGIGEDNGLRTAGGGGVGLVAELDGARRREDRQQDERHEETAHEQTFLRPDRGCTWSFRHTDRTGFALERAEMCRTCADDARRAPRGAPVGDGTVREGQASAPAGTSFLGSTNGIAAVLPVIAPFSDSMSSVVPGSESSIGTQT